MPRKRGYRKKAVATKAVDVRQDRQITRIVRKLNATKPETKWAEYSATLAPDYNGSLVSFNVGLTQGTGDFGNRVGDSLTMKGLRLRLNAYWNAAATTVYRIIVFQYLEDPDGATSSASITNLLLHSTQVGTNLAPFAPYDHDNRTSFKVWHDKVYSHSPLTLTSTNTNPGQARPHEIDIRFKEGSKFAKVKYYAAGTTTTHNELFMLIISDSATALSVPYVGHLYYIDP